MPQIARLRRMIKKSKAQRIIILIHHPPFRWNDEAVPRLSWGDQQRWGFLAFDPSDVQTFLGLLRETVATKEVFLFCGHRHGFRANATDVPVPRCGTYEGIVVAEGAALTDAGTAVLAVVMGESHLEFQTIIPASG